MGRVWIDHRCIMGGLWALYTMKSLPCMDGSGMDGVMSSL